MNSEVWDRVVKICRDVFENDELEFNETTSAKEIEEWDSLTHLNLMSDIEEEFNITFTLEEFSSTKNLGELVNILKKHLEKGEV